MIKFIIRNADLSAEERIEDLKSQFLCFENSDAAGTIVDILERVEGIQRSSFGSAFEFFDHFNSRTGDLHRTTGEKGAEIDLKCAPYKNELYDAFYELGFIANNHADGLREADVLAILGGGFNSNYDRTVKCLNECNKLDRFGNIAALSTYRSIAPAEKEKTAAYSSAVTEFGVLTDCIPAVFGIDRDNTVIFENMTGDLTTSGKIIRFDQQFKGKDIEVYSAPKTDPEMLRANTGDTFKFYFDHNSTSPGDTWLLITSNIYCPTQILHFVPFALEHSLNAQIVGNWEDDHLVTPDSFEVHKYLNELIRVYAEKEHLTSKSF